MDKMVSELPPPCRPPGGPSALLLTGPLCSRFQIQDEKGDVTITNDGATILKQMQVLHPSAKMVRPGLEPVEPPLLSYPHLLISGGLCGSWWSCPRPRTSRPETEPRRWW